MAEATIVINGHQLNDAQSMTIRVALNNFAMELNSNGLGDDEHGRRMTRLYKERIKEINSFLFTSLRSSCGSKTDK